MSEEYDWRDEAQVLARVKKVLPQNTGLCWIACLCAKTHRYAIEYIEQAPVLVVGATFGARCQSDRMTRCEREYVATRFLRLEGKKLKEAMAEFGLPLPLRKLRSIGVTSGRTQVIWRLRRVPPSALSQAIPDGKRQQQVWLSTLDRATAWYERRQWRLPDDVFEWLAVEAGAAVRTDGIGSVPENATQIMDMLVAGQPFNDRWTFAEAVRAHAIWAAGDARHRAGRSADGEAVAMRYSMTVTDTVDYAPFPNEPIEINGLEFTPLRSVRSLQIEGSIMKHCVGAYANDVLSGRCRIFSITRDGINIATLEMGNQAPNYPVNQLKGPRNGRVAKDVSEAVVAFNEVVRKVKKGSTWQIAKTWLQERVVDLTHSS